MSDRSENSWLQYIWGLFLWVLFLMRNHWLSNWQNLRLALTPKPENESKFKVYIYEDELENIREWVRKHDNIETGGDLFGLWIDKHTAVVQLVLGPGKNCQRNVASFYQDIEYLAKTGVEINNNHGLCSIGQWHSHHRLGLAKPSSGDEDTVWGNMPDLGLDRYVVFIATITGSKSYPKVNVHPFLFEIETGKQLPIMEGIYEIPSATHSPLRRNKDILEKLKEGAETMNTTTTKRSMSLDVQS